MARKMYFVSDGRFSYVEKIAEYEYSAGFAVSQKKKCVKSFHDAILRRFPDKSVLEVSSKSNDPFGVSCSAFNLKLDGHPLESVFQSSKVFAGNVSFPEIIDYSPRDAKHFVRDQNLRLIGFRYGGEDFPTEPKSLFYDYIYCKAMIQSNSAEFDVSQVKNYDIFTDIEFNEKKQFNCQARSIAIFKYLLENNKLDEAMKSCESFRDIVYDNSCHILM